MYLKYRTTALEDSKLLGHDTVSSGEQFPTFLRIIVPSSAVSSPGVLDSEDKGTIRNVRNNSYKNIVLHPKRPESSATML